jgi:glutaredoxin-like protein NrdH
MQINTVAGRELGTIMLYTLTTCGWCRKMKNFLSERGIAYSYVDVDTLEGDQKESVMDEVQRWNPACSFPTMVVNNQRCVIGFNESRMIEALGL